MFSTRANADPRSSPRRISAGFQHAPHFRYRARNVGHMIKHVIRNHRIEIMSAERNCLRIVLQKIGGKVFRARRLNHATKNRKAQAAASQESRSIVTPQHANTASNFQNSCVHWQIQMVPKPVKPFLLGGAKALVLTDPRSSCTRIFIFNTLIGQIQLAMRHQADAPSTMII